MNDDPDRARAEAERILSEGRFHETELPRPFQRALDWIGDRLRPIGDLVDRVLPGGDNVVWLALAALVLVLAIAFAASLVRRRGPGAERARRDARGVQLHVDAALLEREADAAEARGDLERALRLRFRAGVARLLEQRQLDDTTSLTTGALVRRFHSDTFTAGARSFDEVVYGRRPPTPDDARRVREAWKAVLAK